MIVFLERNPLTGAGCNIALIFSLESWPKSLAIIAYLGQPFTKYLK